MFETSVVQARAVAQRGYSLLAMSVGVHSAIVIAVVAISINSVRLPKNPPNEFKVFFAPAAPPPPPAAPQQPRAAQHAQPAQPHASTVVPHAATAPALTVPDHIPDAIPTVPSTSAATSTATGPFDPNATPGSGTPGVGDPNSVGGSDDSVSTTVPVPDTVFRPGGEVRPALVLHRVEPDYPRSAIAVRLGGTVVLQCVIDKNGNVRDAQVVTSSHPAFNEVAINALRQWKFSPGVFRGKPVDTYFELTIKFSPR